MHEICAKKSSKYAINMHWDHEICSDIRWKIFEKWPEHSQKFTSGSNSNIFSQIQLMNQNFGKYFEKRVKFWKVCLRNFKISNKTSKFMHKSMHQICKICADSVAHTKYALITFKLGVSVDCENVFSVRFSCTYVHKEKRYLFVYSWQP